MAYAAKVEDKWFAVVDGEEKKAYDGIGTASLIFSSDSKRVAYVAGVGKGQLVVVDGREEAKYDAIGVGTLIFSPDSLDSPICLRAVVIGSFVAGFFFVHFCSLHSGKIFHPSDAPKSEVKS